MDEVAELVEPMHVPVGELQLSHLQMAGLATATNEKREDLATIGPQDTSSSSLDMYCVLVPSQRISVSQPSRVGCFQNEALLSTPPPLAHNVLFIALQCISH